MTDETKYCMALIQYKKLRMTKQQNRNDWNNSISNKYFEINGIIFVPDVRIKNYLNISTATCELN